MVDYSVKQMWTVIVGVIDTFQTCNIIFKNLGITSFSLAYLSKTVSKLILLVSPSLLACGLRGRWCECCHSSACNNLVFSVLFGLISTTFSFWRMFMRVHNFLMLLSEAADSLV